ncbi:MAG: hypothetical protein RL172_3250 [Bacteroidota bacterium]|jgi:peroxiredoxin
MKIQLQWSGLISLLLLACSSFAQTNWYTGKLLRQDGQHIPFTFEWKKEKSKQVWIIHNAAEVIRVDNITADGDSLLVQMPVFESYFKIKWSGTTASGYWHKAGSVKNQVMPFTAEPASQPATVAAGINISGRWAVSFTGGSKPKPLSVGEFMQDGNRLSGSFLTPSGDYRYLQGYVDGSAVYLSAFDGVHAFAFSASIADSSTIKAGTFYSGASYKEPWTAIKDAQAAVSQETVAMYLKPGEERLNFSFKDLNGKTISITDKRFKNKVVVIQLMGSWCPNCMDETAFLSNYYAQHKKRGVEIISLAYEYSTDWDRSVKSLRKFQQRFNVQYPMLITGVAVSDSLRTEKTLPELTPIKFFPSSIILDKNGKVRKLDTGFNGPATGEHHTLYKKEFEATIDELLKEQTTN